MLQGELAASSSPRWPDDPLGPHGEPKPPSCAASSFQVSGPCSTSPQRHGLERLFEQGVVPASWPSTASLPPVEVMHMFHDGYLSCSLLLLSTAVQ